MANAYSVRMKRSKLITESCAPENVILIVRAASEEQCTCRRHESVRVSYWALNQQLYGIQFIDRARTHTAALLDADFFHGIFV
jgi:hypothetical protein